MVAKKTNLGADVDNFFRKDMKLKDPTPLIDSDLSGLRLKEKQ